MIVTGNSLKSLIEQHKIVENSKAFDTFSISLCLNNQIVTYKVPEGSILIYGDDIDRSYIEQSKIPQDGIVLNPKDCFLACSDEKVSIPKGYIGIIQTKGSLARLFVSISCCDGQIESGFTGKITFEICNFGNFPVKLLPHSNVAQLFIFKTSSKEPIYTGKYNNQTLPTFYKQ
jgi:dCTP deaminase